MQDFTLTDEQCDAIYLALKGDVNLSTLQKTKTMLVLQRLPHGVEEVNAKLRVYEGNGTDDVGLLRIFNPQHDMLVEATKPRTKGKGETERDPHTRDMFATDIGVGGVSDAPEPAPSGLLAQVWDESTVPKPRPAKGEHIVQPSGMVTSINDVLGWDVEREAFRVVDVDGWDGFVTSYGQRDAAQWRILTQLLDYPDGSDVTTEPLGSRKALAVDLRDIAASLYAGPAHMTDELFSRQAADVLPLLNAVAPDHIAPDYLREYVTNELAGAEDNAHALARLCEQYAESAEQAEAEGLDAVVAAAHEGNGNGAGAFDGDDIDTEWRSNALDISTEDVADEQALNDGTYEPGGAGDLDVDDDMPPVEGETLGSVQDAVATEREAEAIAAGQLADLSDEPEPSPQRKRNAARAGTKAVTKSTGKGKGK